VKEPSTLLSSCSEILIYQRFISEEITLEMKEPKLIAEDKLYSAGDSPLRE
jgi:hypothetical protein